MIDAHTIPDPGLPLADGHYYQLARATLRAQGLLSREQFAARYGVDPVNLTRFGLLWTVNRTQAEREVRLNALYRAGMRQNRITTNADTTEDETP